MFNVFFFSSYLIKIWPEYIHLLQRWSAACILQPLHHLRLLLLHSQMWIVSLNEYLFLEKTLRFFFYFTFYKSFIWFFFCFISIQSLPRSIARIVYFVWNCSKREDFVISSIRRETRIKKKSKQKNCKEKKKIRINKIHLVHRLYYYSFCLLRPLNYFIRKKNSRRKKKYLA